MDSEQKAISELDRANRAGRLLEDELLRGAIDGIRAGLRNGWENTHQDDVTGRERFYAALWMLDEVERALKEHVNTGKMAEITLENIRAGRTAS